MSNEVPEPLSPKVRELLAGEAQRATLSDEALARLGDRIESSVGWAASAGAAAGAASPAVGALTRWKVLGVLAAGAVAGAGADRLLAPVAVPAPPVIVVVERPAPEAPPSSPEPAPAPAPVPAPRPAPAPRPGVAERDVPLARERALLELARTALSRSKLDEANEALARHEREFPQGTLVEEREALAIQALWLQGKPALAKQRAARFRSRYPDSVLLPSIEPPETP